MAKEDNKAIVRRYIEALDVGNTELIESLFSKDCRIYRPEHPEPLIGVDEVRRVISWAHQLFSEFRTTIHDMLQEENRVAIRITHDAVCRNKCPSRIGIFDCAGKSTKFDAMSMYVLQDGKIVEEYMVRDEIGMLISIGALNSTT
jgi:steroid delta-isomerase-like uncharacterized protein